MQTFEQWVSQTNAVNRITESGASRDEVAIKSLLNEAYKTGAATMLESCIILQDNAERNRGRDRYIASRVHSIPTERH